MDYILVCKDLYQYFEYMTIDDERKITLTKYVSRKGDKKKILSDHNPMFASFNIQYEKMRFKEPRKEIFNLKNQECQTKFLNMTNKGFKFQNCFKSNRSFDEKCSMFMHTLDDMLHGCFRKIRIPKKGKYGGSKSEVNELILQKNKLSLSLNTIGCKIGRCIIENEITKLEGRICDISANHNAEIVMEYTKNIETSSGNFSQLGLWKLKNVLCPKQSDPPMAKKDKYGTLITSPSLIKNLYLETYEERLMNRKIKPELQDLFFLKSELWNLKIEELEGRKTEAWSKEDLEKASKALRITKPGTPKAL